MFSFERDDFTSIIEYNIVFTEVLETEALKEFLLKFYM
jgi:hypothetical protein